MIVNAPSKEGLENASLSIYFRSWDYLIALRNRLVTYLSNEWGEICFKHRFSEEWGQYHDFCQAELQSVYVWMQQANELALKARLCAVSPFLLLINTEIRFKTSVENVDFNELRTLDAVDLPGAVNSMTTEPVSSEYITSYSSMRSNRNKMTHIGQVDIKLDIDDMLFLSIEQYINLWPDRHWLFDRVNFAGQNSYAYFHDGRYASAHASVMEELPMDYEMISKGQFQKLFGVKKSKRRYLCFDCLNNAKTKWSDWVADESKTAVIAKDSDDQIHCLMCLRLTKVERNSCCHEDCPGNVLSAAGDENDQRCNTCGRFPE